MLQRYGSGGDGAGAAPVQQNRQQLATLNWVKAAFGQWERDYPLEPPLATAVARLKPLAARIAISDLAFFVPGRQPLHRLLDIIQEAAVGWHADLGRAGQGLEQHIQTAVDNALAWIDQPDTDLEAIVTHLARMAERDEARAHRMAERLVEAELGHQRKLQASGRAAQMINAAMGRYPVPEPVAEFLTGPWYDSAQLVLLKSGVDSEQWHKMTATTDTLLDSVQIVEQDSGERRQHLFRVVTLLPKELRRQLLSLQHDSEAVEDAVGLVEFAHLCVLRNQPLDTVEVDPLPEAGAGQDPGQQAADTDSQDHDLDQWFRIDGAGDRPLRVRLVFSPRDGGQMLFTNRAGIEALRLTGEEFQALAAEGRAAPLDCGASFSRCLAAAAGIASEEDLQLLAEQSSQSNQAGAEPEEETEEQEQARLMREWQEARRRQQEMNNT